MGISHCSVMQPHTSRLPMGAALADTSGQTCWGCDCGWDKGAWCCAMGNMETRKTRGPSAQDTGTGWPCVLQAWIQQYFAATPLYVQAQPGCLFESLSCQRVPTWNQGCNLSPVVAALPRTRSNRSSPGGPGLWGLSLAFASHSSTSHTVTRALEEKRLLQPECLGQKQMVHKLLSEILWCPGRSTLPKRTWDVCWFSFFLEFLKCSSKEKSTFFSWFWFAAGVCPFLTWIRSCGKQNVLCLWRVHTIPISCSLMENSKPFIGQGMDKESLVACGALSCWCFFSTCAHKSPKGPCVPIGNRSVKLITKNTNSGGKKMIQEGGKTERSQRDAIYWAWFMMLAGSSLPEPDESDSLSVCAAPQLFWCHHG